MLANVVRKPLRQIFSEFAGVGPQGEGQEYFGTGDVKYHLGTSYDRPTTSGKRVHLSLLANPSHLEARLAPRFCPFLPTLALFSPGSCSALMHTTAKSCGGKTAMPAPMLQE